MSGSVWNPVGWINTAFADFINFIQPIVTAVRRTVQSKLEEHISIKDFGAVCDGITDDTSAVQAAITYAVTAPGGITPIIEVPGFTNVRTNTLVIDRPTDVALDELRFVGVGELPGFYTTGTGNIFTSSIPHTTDPVSEWVTFEGINFHSPDWNNQVKVMDGDKFRRVKFVNCYFLRTKAAICTNFAQSWRFLNCQMRQWKDWFLSCKGMYDLHVHACVFESAIAQEGKGFSEYDPTHVTGTSGCSFISNVFEGAYGPFVSLADAQGVLIAGNYGEGNSQMFLDFSQGTTWGVVVSGNYVQSTAANKANIGFAEIVVGVSNGFCGQGNYVDGRMYNLLSPGGNYDIGNGDAASIALYIGNDPAPATYASQLKFPATAALSADPNTLDDYKEGTFTPVIEGLTTAGVGIYTAQVGTYTKIGNRVIFNLFVSWTAHTGTGNMAVTGLPYTAKNISNGYNVVSNRPGNLTLPANTILVTSINPNESRVILESTPTGGGAAAGVAMDVAANIMISGQYSV